MAKKIISNKLFQTDLSQFWLLIVSAIISIFYMPTIVNQLVFIGYLFLFWRTKNNALWLAFFFILIAHPANLFQAGYQGATNKIPSFALSAGLTFSFFDILYLVGFVKVLAKSKPVKLRLSEHYTAIALLIFVHLIYTLSLGVNFNEFIQDIRKILGYLMIFIIPRLLRSKDDLKGFSILVFSASFLVIFGQFYYLLTGSFLRHLFGGGGSGRVILEQAYGTTDFLRPMAKGAMIIYYTFIFSLFYILDKKQSINKTYVFTVLIVSIFSVVMSATRTWIIVFAFVLLLYFIYVNRLSIRAFLMIGVVIVFIVLLYSLIPEVRYTIDNSFRRFETIGALAQGDLTAGGTLSRITERLPRLMEGINQGPIFGWGFSNIYHKYSDNHVANFDVILQFGIVGQFLFLYLYIGYFSMLYFNHRKLSHSNSLKKPLKSLTIQFVGLLVFQFSTFAFFGISTLFSDVVYFTSIYMIFSEVFISHSIAEEIEIRKLNALVQEKR